jgi:RND family efflux transporter MFP subunit
MRNREAPPPCTIRPRETQAELVGARTLLQHATTEAERQEAQRALDLAQATQNLVAVRADGDGVVAARSVTEGELVTENAALMELVDPSSAVFIAGVPLLDAGRLRPGCRGALAFPSLPEREIPAVVDAIYPAADPQSQTVAVRLLPIPDSQESRSILRPSMMGTCRVTVAVRANIFRVPKKALLRDDERGAYALVVVGEDSIARHIPVTVGLRDDSTAEVHGEGIAAGVAVVTEGNYGLPDSTKVTWDIEDR